MTKTHIANKHEKMFNLNNNQECTKEITLNSHHRGKNLSLTM